ncbi:ABC transporter ATP-binding protein/permease [Pleurocapsa sp. CCALA 161]|uniref:ABC transporter ATP-binding protein/permease n=1 Tax=Pleurocapsa sp. CCALA 161 TaxID=2107688 RepID=UPI0018EDF6E2|nr:ABC transporter ATP-binding protein/permease [Pleurocapsa sp. CCALA 161]
MVDIAPQINRIDGRLWQRFIKVALPYWYPSKKKAGTFFLMLLLLLIFLFAALFMAIAGTLWLGQQLFPQFTNEAAAGLIGMRKQIFANSTAQGILALALILPTAVFAWKFPRWQGRVKQWGLLSALLLFSIMVSGLNVVISFTIRFIETALVDKDESTFWLFLWVYGGVFVVGTAIVVIYSYCQKLLGVYWREWLTQNILQRYLENRAYYQINAQKQIDNPDQRIAEDIQSFTGTSLTLLLSILDSVITLVSFVGVLWAISSSLSLVLVGYALFGTIVTVLLGKRLIGLNYNQLQREADFRYGLVHLRDNAESIAFYGGESQELTSVGQRFARAIRNYHALIGWQRNLEFFTTGHSYFVRILPYLVVAPLFLAGQIDFGAIGQATVAFFQIFGALTLIIGQFQLLTAFAAGINRIAILDETLTDLEEGAVRESGATKIGATIDSRLALEEVTLLTPDHQQTLVEDLSVAVEPQQSLAIVGESGVGKSSLLRAIAGLWNMGSGNIVRPASDSLLFLPQKPYMILGTLRQQLLYPHTDSQIPDEQLEEALRQVNLADLTAKVGGLDVELSWSDVLSLGEQQRLAFARLLLTKPSYAILDEATSALDVQNEKRLYRMLQQSDTTIVSVGHRPSLLQYHQKVLKLRGQSQWQVLSVEDYLATFNELDT